jgi:hypothetical protein
MKDNISEDQVFDDYQGGLPKEFKLKGTNIRRKDVDLQAAPV